MDETEVSLLENQQRGSFWYKKEEVFAEDMHGFRVQIKSLALGA